MTNRLIRLARRMLLGVGVRDIPGLTGARPVRRLQRLVRAAAVGPAVVLFSAAWRYRVPREARRARPVVLFVSHPERQCGVHEFGDLVARALRASTTFRFVYVECQKTRGLLRALLRHRPVAIIYNYHPDTMVWVSVRLTALIRRVTDHEVRQIGIIHECAQAVVDAAVADRFDYHIAPDPTLVPRNPIVFTTGRLVPEYVNRLSPPEVVTVGSLGFGGSQKRYDLVVEAVQREFDRARVRINIAHNGVADVEGVLARQAAERCRNVRQKEGIDVEITHHFFDRQGMLDFLAGNTLNAFFYDWEEARGISAVVESALAVDRPVAVNRTPMFRHVWEAKPSICIEETSLRTIIANGAAPLRPFVEQWTAAHLRAEYEAIVSKAIAADYLYAPSVTDPERPTHLNRILDDEARALYEPAIRKLFLLSPDVMDRKIAKANVQQAFMLDTIQALVGRRVKSARILCVGCHEDTAFISLQRLGYRVVGIDPAVNCDLRTFSARRRSLLGTFDVVFSTSVLEHVVDDEEFMSQTADFVRPGGYAVTTCDYNDAYTPGDPIPAADRRLYTQRDLRGRILPAMKRCTLVDPADWNCPAPDFTYEGCRYTFATLTVRKHG